MNIFANNKGAMLFNVVISVSIMVLLLTLSLPYLKKYQTNLKLSAAAKNLAADLRLAQQLTISEQTAYQIELDSFNNDYQLIRTGAATSTIKSVTLDPEIAFQEIQHLTGNKVIFNSYGGAFESGEIILRNSEGATSNVNIKPSGYVELSE